MVLGNFIGTDINGTASIGNTNDGVFIANGAAGNTIGGSSGASNVISGNTNAGVEFAVPVSANLVSFNLIGTNAAESAVLGNAVGLRFSESNDTIGPGSPADPSVNTIASNTTALQLAGNSNLLDGLAIGPAAHALGLPNGTGVLITGHNNTLGGTTSGARNVISGNSANGVSITGAANLMEGNFIGTDSTGAAALSNGIDGIIIFSASNTIGGTAAGAGNVISGNIDSAVDIFGSGASGNVVLGNLIGTDVHGTTKLANTIEGVGIYFGATANTVGGSASGAGNVISGNGLYGVGLHDGGTSGNVVLGNLIGSDVNGSAALGNGLDGVFIGSATANTVGGTASGAANVISGNSFYGVFVSNGGTTGNVVLGNKIGADVTGAAKLGNAKDGVGIFFGATANTVGGTASGAGNVISGNNSVGVYLTGSGTSGNVVLGNLIGTAKNGSTALGNLGDGVLIAGGATRNTVGGAVTGAVNVISGNHANGVQISGNGTSGNLVLGNKIGTDKSGSINLGNVGDGVYLSGGASSNTIGGTTSGTGNFIAFNAEGVVLNGATTVGNSILGNSIFSNKGVGISLGSPAGNHGQAAPANATVTASSYSATLTSANGTYRVEVFASPASGPAFQGKTFLGAINVVIANGSKTFTLSGLSIPAGSTVTATATNLSIHDTSAFSTATAMVGTRIVVTSNPTITQSSKAQTIRLTALVTSIQPVNAGTVTFTIVGLGSVTVPVVNGVATANFVVPANTPAGDYKIIGVYNPVDDFLGSTTANSDPDYDGVLTIDPSPTHKSKS